MKRFLRGLAWLVGALVVLGLLGGLFIYSGVFNVAATYPDPKPVFWLLLKTSSRSIRHHAADIAVPTGLDDPAMIEAGLGHYRVMCQTCHGAPGVQPDDLAKGLNPHPPGLIRAAKFWKPNELFWVTKYGVRMTGMPAWAPTHTDEEIWQITAFMEQMPTMTPAQYQAMSKTAPPMKDKTR